MENTFNKLRERYLIDGENDRYATYFKSREDIDEMGMDEEEFESMYGITVDDVRFPAIGFDTVGASTSGGIYLYQTELETTAEDMRDYIIRRADDYFRLKPIWNGGE